MAGAFVQGKKFARGSEGDKHLAHVLREKTQRDLSGDIEVHGDIHAITDQPEPMRKRGGANYFYEVMTYSSGAEIEATRKYLSAKTGRAVVGVHHRDEAVPHTHYLIPWVGPDRKSLRLSLGDFNEINNRCAAIVGRSMTAKGQGRDMVALKEYMADPAAAQEKIKAQTAEIAAIREGIAEMLGIYGSIGLAAIRPGKPGKIDLGRIDSVDQVNIKRLRRLIGRGEGIYFRPTERDTHDVLFLDDVPADVCYQWKDCALIVETSPGRHQLHARLDEGVPTDMAKRIQGAMCHTTGADLGCGGDVYHFRRLPGTPNTKYDDAPRVRIAHAGSQRIRADGWRKAVCLYRMRSENIMRRIPKAELVEAPKRWTNYAGDDLSVSDMRYVVYLVARGMGLEQIRARLEAESPDLALRKRGNPDAYIERTYHRAIDYLTSGKPNQDPEAGPEN